MNFGTEQRAIVRADAVDGCMQRWAARLRPTRLGDALRAGGLVTEAQLRAALAVQKATREPLGKILVRQGAVSVLHVYRALARQWALKAALAALIFILQGAPAPSMAATAPVQHISAVFHAEAGERPRGAVQNANLRADIRPGGGGARALGGWTEAMARFTAELETGTVFSPRLLLWKNEIRRLRGHARAEQAEGIQDFFAALTPGAARGATGSGPHASPLEVLMGRGAEEDLAIAKYASLRALGVPAADLRIVLLRDGEDLHAALTVHTEDGPRTLTADGVAAAGRVVLSFNAERWWLHRAA